MFPICGELEIILFLEKGKLVMGSKSVKYRQNKSNFRNCDMCPTIVNYFSISEICIWEGLDATF
jgi:hypothetical protein